MYDRDLESIWRIMLTLRPNGMEAMEDIRGFITV